MGLATIDPHLPFPFKGFNCFIKYELQRYDGFLEL